MKFAPQVQIVSEAGRVTATEPLAADSGSTETDDATARAVLSDQLPFTSDANLDQNSPATVADRSHIERHLQTQNANESSDTDRTDNIRSMDVEPRGTGRPSRDRSRRERMVRSSTYSNH